MAVQNYWFSFGTGAASDNSGLAPTFITFADYTGQTLAPPGITEPLASSGMYLFQYEASLSIGFVIDGATTGLSSSDRYIKGALDQSDRNNEFIVNAGISNMQGFTILGQSMLQGFTILGQSVAAGFTSVLSGITGLVTSVGSTASVIGDSSTDPGTLYGFLKRAQEVQEGDGTYTKATGVWAITDRSGNTTLASKTITESTSTVTKA